MVDVATLAYAVDTAALKGARQALAEFQQANDEAASSADRVGASFTASGSRATGFVSDIAGAGVGAAAVGEAFVKHAAAAEKSGEAMSLSGREAIKLEREFGELGAGILTGDQSFSRMSVTAQRLAVGLSKEGGVASVLQDVGSSLSGILTPANVAIGGLVAIGVAGVSSGVYWSDAQEKITGALRGVGLASGITRADIENIGTAAAKAGQTTVGSAIGISAALAHTGQVSIETNQLITTHIRDLVKVMGTDVPTAGQKLAEVLSGPVDQAALKLNADFNFLTGPMLISIQRAQAFGDVMGATNVIAQGIVQTTKGMAEETSFVERSWQEVKNAVTGAAFAMGKALDDLDNRLTGKPDAGLPILDRFVKAKSAMDELIQRAFAFQNEVKNAGDATERMYAQAHYDQIVAQINAAKGAYEKLGEELRKQEGNEAQATATQQSLKVEQITHSLAAEAQQYEELTGKLKQFQQVLANPLTGTVTGSGEQDARRELALIQLIHNRSQESQDADSQEVAGYKQVQAAFSAYLAVLHNGVATAEQVKAAQLQFNQAVSQFDQVAKTVASAEDIVNAKHAASIQMLNAETNAERLSAIDAQTRAQMIGSSGNVELAVKHALETANDTLANSGKTIVDSYDKQIAQLNAHTDAQKIDLAATNAYNDAVKKGIEQSDAITIKMKAQEAEQLKLKQAGDQFVTSLKNQVENLQLENDMFGKSAGEIEEARIKLQAFQQGLDPAAVAGYAAKIRELTDANKANAQAAQADANAISGLNSAATSGSSSSASFGANLKSSIALQARGQALTPQQRAVNDAQQQSILDLANANAQAAATAKYGSGNFQFVPGTLTKTGLNPQTDSPYVITQPQVVPIPGASNASTSTSSSASGSGLFNTTDPGIGFHAASGFDGIVPGTGGGDDTVPLHAWVSPGERVTVTPAGESPSNDNASASQIAALRPINFNITTPDTRGFYRSRAQIAAQARRIVGG